MKTKKNAPTTMPADPDHDEWADRDNVDTMLKYDKLRQDSRAHKRASSRLKSAARLAESRSKGRSSGR